MPNNTWKEPFFPTYNFSTKLPAAFVYLAKCCMYLNPVDVRGLMYGGTYIWAIKSIRGIYPAAAHKLVEMKGGSSKINHELSWYEGAPKPTQSAHAPA